MPSLEFLIPFAAATLVFAVMPGPAILYTAAETIARGRRAGLMAAFGLHVGGMVHVSAAAAGLSAVFAYVPEAFLALKIAGALYLIWLGIGMIRGRLDAASLPGNTAPRRRRAFLRAIAVELLNPKAALFFIAFLPQFADPNAAWPVWVQMLILGWIVDIAFSMGDLVTVAVTSTVLRHLRANSARQRLVRWIGGSVLIGLGLKLATDQARP
jgi:threonine/homoserine/homoserine lactone efflux protein